MNSVPPITVNDTVCGLTKAWISAFTFKIFTGISLIILSLIDWTLCLKETTFGVYSISWLVSDFNDNLIEIGEFALITVSDIVETE